MGEHRQLPSAVKYRRAISPLVLRAIIMPRGVRRFIAQPGRPIMADKPNPAPVALSRSDAPNPNAPFIYVDGIGVYGETNGIAHIALEVVRHNAADGGKRVASETVTVAHLRLPPHAFASLKSAMEGIELMIKAAPNPAKN
jgi:hypothetical protein